MKYAFFIMLVCCTLLLQTIDWVDGRYIKFLKNADSHQNMDIIKKDSLSQDMVAIIPVSQTHNVNEYIFSFLKKYIASLDRVILFMHNEHNEVETGTLFAQMFPDYKYVSYIVAPKSKEFLKHCIMQLNNEIARCGSFSYIIVTHSQSWHDCIKDNVLADYKGSEFCSLRWGVCWNLEFEQRR